MEQQSDWTPEQGDEAWLPDLTRTAESYGDAELRFSPLGRLVRQHLEGASEADILAATRQALIDVLPDDEAREDLIAALAPDPEDGD